MSKLITKSSMKLYFTRNNMKSLSNDTGCPVFAYYETRIHVRSCVPHSPQVFASSSHYLIALVLTEVQA